MKCQNLFSLKNKKKNISLCSLLKFLSRDQSIKKKTCQSEVTNLGAFKHHVQNNYPIIYSRWDIEAKMYFNGHYSYVILFTMLSCLLASHIRTILCYNNILATVLLVQIYGLLTLSTLDKLFSR